MRGYRSEESEASELAGHSDLHKGIRVGVYYSGRRRRAEVSALSFLFLSVSKLVNAGSIMHARLV